MTHHNLPTSSSHKHAPLYHDRQNNYRKKPTPSTNNLPPKNSKCLMLKKESKTGRRNRMSYNGLSFKTMCHWMHTKKNCWITIIN
mmetsp:Transcript_26328/g.38785  ORF Transcript_26328/g.38785 Transcript_26328/m.38785 type:complete len:85 (-) Transcript_26328:118-372(-)